MSGMNIILYDRIKLKNSETDLLTPLKTIKNQFFSDMLSSGFRRNCITGIADMSTSTYIIRMKNI